MVKAQGGSWSSEWFALSLSLFVFFAVLGGGSTWVTISNCLSPVVHPHPVCQLFDLFTADKKQANSKCLIWSVCSKPTLWPQILMEQEEQNERRVGNMKKLERRRGSRWKEIKTQSRMRKKSWKFYFVTSCTRHYKPPKGIHLTIYSPPIITFLEVDEE